MHVTLPEHDSPRAHLGTLVRQVRGDGYSVLQSVQPEGLEVEAHAHAGISLCFLMSGGFQETGRGGRRHRAGGFVVAPPGEAVGLRFGPGPACALVVDVAPALWRDVVFDREPPTTSRTRRDSVIVGMAHRLRVELADGVRGPALEEAVLVLCHEISMAGTSDRPVEVPSRALSRALEVLHDGFRGPVRLQTVADHAGVHRMSLARAFRRHVGLSVGEYLHRLRVSYAMARLGSPAPPRLAELATEAGFADQSHLTRVFRRVCGRTPGGFRRAASIVQDLDARRALSSGHALDTSTHVTDRH